MNGGGDLGKNLTRIPQTVGAFTCAFSILLVTLPKMGCAGSKAIDGKKPKVDEISLASINTMGEKLYARGKFEQAAQLFREALTARRRTLGDRDADTLTSINNLGMVLQAQGKLDEAAPLLREALEGRSATLGNFHINTLMSINNLGLLLQAQGQLDEAEPMLREALEASRATLGDRQRHPSTLSPR